MAYFELISFYIRKKQNVRAKCNDLHTGRLYHTALYQICMLPIDFGGNQQENTSVFKQGGVGVMQHSPPITHGDCSYSV